MNAVRQRLREIPPRLSDLLKDILLRDSENMEDLFICLQWILFAKRPLSPHELFLAIQAHGEAELPLNAMQSADHDWTALAKQSMPAADLGPTISRTSSSDSDKMVRRFLLSASKGLAEITKSRKSPTVQFIHESVRDFLLKNEGLTHLMNEMNVSLIYRKQELLKMCCLNYIKASYIQLLSRRPGLPQAKTAEANAMRTETSTLYPFLEYAVVFVLEHADQSAAEGTSQTEFVANFCRTAWIYTNNLFEKHQIRRYTADAPLMYLFADRDLPSLIHVAIKQELPINSPDERNSCPITAALQRVNLKAVKVLLSGKNDHPQLQDRLRAMFDPDRLKWPGLSAHVLSSILVKCRVELLRTLLETRALDKNATFFSTHAYSDSLLTCAIDNKSHDCVRLLLDHGADANMSPPVTRQRFPLHLVLKNRDMQSVNWLIDAGADVNHPFVTVMSSHHRLPLLWAISEGDVKTVEVLLAARADLELASESDPTYPLLAAVSEERDTIVKLLLSAGANPNGLVTNKVLGETIRRATPLHFAILGGNSKTVALLLEHGADPNVEYPQDCTTIRKFLDSRPRNKADSLRNKLANHSPLYVAMACSGIEVLSCLVDAGAILSACDRNNPLGVKSLVFHAFIEDRIEIAKWLISARLTGTIDNPISSLHSVIMNNQSRIVAWILELVEDLMSTECNGKSYGAVYSDLLICTDKKEKRLLAL
jgi:ankyrin repeat protein